jgi:hypothetical protein
MDCGCDGYCPCWSGADTAGALMDWLADAVY